MGEWKTDDLFKKYIYQSLFCFKVSKNKYTFFLQKHKIRKQKNWLIESDAIVFRVNFVLHRGKLKISKWSLMVLKELTSLQIENTNIENNFRGTSSSNVLSGNFEFEFSLTRLNSRLWLAMGVLTYFYSIITIMVYLKKPNT